MALAEGHMEGHDTNEGEYRKEGGFFHDAFLVEMRTIIDRSRGSSWNRLLLPAC